MRKWNIWNKHFKKMNQKVLEETDHGIKIFDKKLASVNKLDSFKNYIKK